MTDSVFTGYRMNYLLDQVINHKVFGTNLEIYANSFESDGRKQRKVLREFEEAGWIAALPKDKYGATPKIYQLTEQKEPDLLALWEDSLRSWNRHSYPFVRWNPLSAENKKWVIEHQDAYTYWLTYENMARGHELQEGELVGPIAFADIPSALEKARADYNEKHGYRYASFELLIQTPQMKEECEKRVLGKKIEEAYRRNLKWGLVKLGVLTEEQGEHIKADDTPDFCNPYGNFGENPAKWDDDAVTMRVDALLKTIDVARERLAVLIRMQAEIRRMGGWDVFKQKYRDAVAEAINKK